MALPDIWIGSRYQDGGLFSKRVLLVGESTYPAPGDDIADYNKRIPTEHINGSSRDNFRTRLVRALLGHEESPPQIEAVWQSVAFFNYITAPLSGPGEAPTEHMWQAHHQPLAERLNQLQPDVLLCLSFRLWDRLTTAGVLVGRPGPVLVGAGRPATLLVRLADGSDVVAYGIKHPSYMSWRTEHGFINRLLTGGTRAPSQGPPSMAPRLVNRQQ